MDHKVLLLDKPHIPRFQLRPRVRKMKVEVLHQLRNEFGNLHQTYVLAHASPRPMAELKKKRGQQKSTFIRRIRTRDSDISTYRQPVSVHPLHCLFIGQPSLRPELIGVITKYFPVSMSRPGVDANLRLFPSHVSAALRPRFSMLQCQYSPLPERKFQQSERHP